MVLLIMEDMRVATVGDIEKALDVDYAIAYGILHGMVKRGWLVDRKEPPYGLQLSSTGWLLASAEESDELELTCP